MSAFRLVSIGVVIALALAFGMLLALAPERVARQSARFLRVGLCRLGCKALGLRVEMAGAPPAGGPVLLVVNHISWTDVLALGSVAPVVFTARHDLAHWPLLGPLARAYGTIFVDRGRRRCIPVVNRQIAASMEASEVVVLFPEATTGDGTRLRKFHSPHLAAARDFLEKRADAEYVDVTPVALAYTRRNGHRLGRNGRAAVAWYGDTEFLPHLLDLVRSSPTCCSLRFLAPIGFDRATDRKIVARKAATAIRTAFVGEVMEVAPERATAYVLSGPQAL